MLKDPVATFAFILLLGMLAQWLAWKLRMPSILFLLVFGFLAGPVSGVLNPDTLFGDLLFPLVSVSVGLILFEGGMTLRLHEFRSVGGVAISLVTVGVAVTWIIATLAAYFILGFSWQIALLFGAILTVTGPTVIGPLLRHVQPSGRLSHILKWEGIVIDPIGALLAVIVFDIIYLDQVESLGIFIVVGLGKTVLLGGAIGFAGARLLVFLLKRFWLPDMLKETFTLSLVIGAFSLANSFQHESGLFAVTIMGLFLDNQREAMVKDIVNFKETLRVLLISSLFIILSARIDMAGFSEIWIPGLIFLAALVFIARPASVFVSTLNSKLNLKEKAFISWMAPRGIVAAAVASLFSLKLLESGIELEGAEQMSMLTFMVIAGTVTLYGLTARPFASIMGLAQPKPQGVLMFGAHPWAREIALELQQNGVAIALVDSNRRSVHKARLQGLPAYFGDALSERVLDEIDIDGIGKLLALTSNDHANALAVLHYAEVFDREELYQLIPEKMSEQQAKKEDEDSPMHLRGRYLFGTENHFQKMSSRFREEVRMASTLLTKEFTFEDFMKRHKGTAIPMFIITTDGDVRCFTTDKEIVPRAGQTLISMVKDGNARNQVDDEQNN